MDSNSVFNYLWSFILGPVEYYQSSKAIIENNLYVSLQYVDSYIDELKKNRDTSELFENSFSMFDNELEAQVRDINTINKFKLPKNDIMQMVQIQWVDIWKRYEISKE